MNKPSQTEGLKRASSPAALRRQIRAWRAAGERIALVPTMGALHSGHAALVHAARRRASKVVVSIFVNPTQFGPSEDFSRYPRTLADDLARLRAARADLVYLPSVDDMYPTGFATTVSLTGPANGLESDFRPTHFNGVAIVVAKLLIQAAPDLAFFGEKDYQQLQVITHMVRDLDLPTAIIGVPTVRESDGLALSSRNVYLTRRERQTAPTLHLTLLTLQERLNAGVGLDTALSEGRKHLSDQGFAVDYLEARHAHTLQSVTSLEEPIRLLVAAKLGKTRLIDNIAFRSDA